jgi:hypothetical protein
MNLLFSIAWWMPGLRRAERSWRAARVCLVALLVLGLVFPATRAFGQECKRKTPIRYIGICAHPHGPAHNEWTYDFSGNPVLGPAARQLVACHDVMPLSVPIRTGSTPSSPTLVNDPSIEA